MRICFAGKMRAGKDTAANYLITKYGGGTFKFADPLYEMQQVIYKIAKLPYNTDTKDRTLLQFLGTDWGRKTIDPNIWINVMDLRLASLKFSKENIFITDARFPNEIELLEKYNFKIVQIQCDEHIRIQRGATNLTHESETALDNKEYKFVIENNNSLSYFLEQVGKFYAESQRNI